MAGYFSFDAEIQYPETMQVFDLDAENLQWELGPAGEFRREDQQRAPKSLGKYDKG